MIDVRRPRVVDRDWSTTHEWLEANGVGGWASSSVSGMNTRRYHGMLVAALRPPGDRRVLVARLDETLVTPDGERFELGVNQFDGVVHPQGDQFLQRFALQPFPSWTYEAGPFRLRKTVAAIHGQNTTVVQYECREAPEGSTIELRPFIAGRGYHHLGRANNAVGDYVGFSGDALWLRPYPHDEYLRIAVPGGHFVWDPAWHYGFRYMVEQERGLDDREDLWVPGAFRLPLTTQDEIAVVLTTEHENESGGALVKREKRRRAALVPKGFDGSKAVEVLYRAADAFVVRRADDATTIIAGYPWFEDWGRDTMIALPGLLLATGRHDEARNCLAAWIEAIDAGLLPNRFPDASGEPEYNSVDAALWLFVAARRYLDASEDEAFAKELLPALRSIVEAFEVGTRHGIAVDPGRMACCGRARSASSSPGWMRGSGMRSSPRDVASRSR